MSAASAFEYKQHRPEQTVLFGIVRDHLGSFLERSEQVYGKQLPLYVRAELDAYLKCGIHAHGFARAVCQSCGHELLVAFSCKKRGVCPSCNGRRMCDTAARLVDNVSPDIRLRQWVLSIPFELRIVLAKSPEVLSACGRIFVEEIFRWQRQVALPRGREQVRGAAINFPQRFGGSLNLNVHFHVVVPDAFFFLDEEGEVRSELLPKPSAFDLSEITHNLTCRLLKWMRKRKYIAADDEVRADEYEDSTTSPMDAFLGGSLGMGQLAELKRSSGQASTATEHRSVTASKRVRAGVFNVHASTCATSKEERERLIRYCARPPLSWKRLSRTPDGQVAYQLKTPIGKKTHRVLSPEEFLARLCALIPPPRHPLIRFHGVVAPNSKWRRLVVPAGQTPDEPAEPAAQELPALSPSRDDPPWYSTPLDWATLLKRVYNIDVLACPCGGRLKFVELVEEPLEIRRHLERQGYPSPVLPPRKSSPPNNQQFYDAALSDDTYFHDPIYDDS